MRQIFGSILVDRYVTKQRSLLGLRPSAEFKACVRYFHQFFVFFSPNDSPSKTMKKGSFRSRDI